MSNQNKLVNEIKNKRRFVTQRKTVNKIISHIINIQEGMFNENSVIKEMNDSDELDILEIITAIEREYGILIPDELFSSFKTVGDFYEYLRINV